MINYKIHTHTQRTKGMVLMMAMIISSIMLLLGINIANIAAKQIYLTSFGKQSQIALFMADSMIECALYWDTINGGMIGGKYYFPPQGGTKTIDPTAIDCLENSSAPNTPQNILSSKINATSNATPRISTFGIPPKAGGLVLDGSGSAYNYPCAEVKIVKTNKSPGPGNNTSIQAQGYNTCNTADPRRVQRGLQVDY